MGPCSMRIRRRRASPKNANPIMPRAIMCGNLTTRTILQECPKMSTSSKVAFGLCCTVSVGIIGYVHYKQAYDREQLHLGVIRDIERRERRKVQNVYILQQQAELTKELRKEMTTAQETNT